MGKNIKQVKVGIVNGNNVETFSIMLISLAKWLPPGEVNNTVSFFFLHPVSVIWLPGILFSRQFSANESYQENSSQNLKRWREIVPRKNANPAPRHGEYLSKTQNKRAYMPVFQQQFHRFFVPIFDVPNIQL